VLTQFSPLEWDPVLSDGGMRRQSVVVLYHASVTLVPEMYPLVSMGQTGVTFFFLLSGFVLAWSMNPSTSKWQFYWRRFARIWPLHALTALAAVVLVFATQGEQSVPQLLDAPRSPVPRP
jgi:peptidoglycan/LPS O-acetylase OafA/YrhL